MVCSCVPPAVARSPMRPRRLLARVAQSFLVPTEQVGATSFLLSLLSHHLRPAMPLLALEPAKKLSGTQGNRYRQLFDGVLEALRRYANVHRGSGQHSIISTELYEMAREVVLQYLEPDGDLCQYDVIFGSSYRIKNIKQQLMDKGWPCKVMHSCDIDLPIGVSVAVVGKGVLNFARPTEFGGGMVRLVTKDKVVYADAPDLFEAGTPNIIGVIMFARALRLKPETLRAKGAALSIPEIFEDALNGYGKEQLLIALRETYVGRDAKVSTQDGDRPYVCLDNGASTPTFQPIWEVYQKVIHQPVTNLEGIIAEVNKIVAQFFGAPQETYGQIFTSNTTEAINIVAENMRPKAEEEMVVLNTMLEHNSNELPWREVARKEVVRLEVDENGFIDPKKLKQILIDYNDQHLHGKQRIRLVAVSGASNVLGSYNDIAEICRIAHEHGVEVLVDAAQMAAHRLIDIYGMGIDYLVCSGHKMYAPFGVGLLIARRAWLEARRGREASGRENVAGIAAMGKAMQLLQRIGFDVIEAEERKLMARALRGMQKIRGVKIFGISDPDNLSRKGGVIAFHLQHMPHDIVAKLLAELGGIGVRTGCFCAHILIQTMLGLNRWRMRIAIFLSRFFPGLTRIFFPGLVRLSFGLENTEEDVDRFLATLEEISSLPVSYINRLLAYYHSGAYAVPCTVSEGFVAAQAHETVRKVYTV